MHSLTSESQWTPGCEFNCALQADNPGLWMFHCHIFWHRFMGQGLTFVTAAELLSPPPAGLPACPSSCTYNTAPFVSTAVLYLLLSSLSAPSGFIVPGPGEMKLADTRCFLWISRGLTQHMLRNVAAVGACVMSSA